MAGSGLLLLFIGFLFVLFGIGGAAKLNLGKFGVLTGSSGLVLIVLGALFLSSGV
jgi:hypothetical protein